VKESVAVAFEFGDPFPRALVLGNEYAKETPPVTLPADCGANVVVRLTLCPGTSVAGSPSPLKANPAPDTVPWEIVRFELATLLRNTDWDRLPPI
jgi:hypothetical protein